MITLELRSLSSPDVDIDSWEADSQDVCILLELELGILGESGGDNFEVIVATPDGLRAHATPDENGVLSKRGTLVLQEFSWPIVRRTIATILEDCRSDNWAQSVVRLQRYFFWEFEDYRSQSTGN